MEEGFYLYGKSLKKELPKDEQNALLLLVHQGDKTAKDILFEHNLRLVGTVLKRHYYQKTKDEQEELFSVGAEGLLKAIDNFNPSLNVEFSTYAIPMIYGKMRRFVRDDNTVKVPRTLKTLAFEIIELRNKYSKQNSGIELSISEVAKILNKSEKDINEALNAVQQVSSFSDIVYTSKDDKSLTILDIVADQNFSIDEKILEEEKTNEIKKAMNNLSSRDRKIIELLFGLNGEPKTQIEVAKELNISQAQVSRICKKSLEKMALLLPSSIKDEYQQPTNNKVEKKNSEKKKQIKVKLTIYELFPAYTKEEVLLALSLLTEAEKKLILLCHPENKETIEEKSIGEIANDLGVSYATLNFRKKSIIKKINKILYEKKFNLNYIKKEKVIKKKVTKEKKGEFVMKEKEIDIFELYPEHTKEQVLDAVNKLNEQNKLITELRFGLNGKDKISLKEIAEQVGINYGTLSVRINYIKKAILNHLENPEIEKKNDSNSKTEKQNRSRIDNIFELYPGHTKEEILKAIDALSDENKLIAELRFGLNGKDRIGLKELANKMNLSYIASNSRINYIKKSISKFLNKEKNIEITNEEENTKISKETKTTRGTDDIFKIYPDHTKEEVLEAINLLNEQYKKTIELRYGLNGNKVNSIAEIAQIFKEDEKYTRFRLNNSRTRLTLLLKNQHQIKTNQKDKKFDTKNQKLGISINITNKLEELKQQIYDNKFNSMYTSYKIDNCNITINRYESLCYFAYKDIRKNNLDRPNSTSNDCYVYIINVTDKNNQNIKQLVFVQDKKTKQFYKFVTRYTNGEYDLSAINDGELVCYDVGKTPIKQIPSPVQDKNKENIEKKKIISVSIYNEQDKEEAKKALTTGINHIKERKLVLAEPFFIRALETDEKFILQRANHYLGKIYLAKNKVPIAEEYFKKSLSYNNQDYQTLIELGKTLVRQQRYEEAKECFNKCNQVNPNRTEHVIEKSKIYSVGKDYENAFLLINHAISKNPKNYFGHLEKGKLLFELGKYEEAKKHLDICQELNNEATQHKLLLGKIAFFENDQENIEKYFGEAIEKDLENNTVYNIINLGYFFHKMGEQDLAYQYYMLAPHFKKWCHLSKEEVENHMKQHADNSKNERMHSVFNFSISIDAIETLIQNAEKVATREMYDVYQFYCKGAGYMIVDDQNKIDEDYITILTLPFTKKVMQCYPDKALSNITNQPTIRLEDLLKKTEETNIEIIEISEQKSEEIVQEETIDTPLKNTQYITNDNIIETEEHPNIVEENITTEKEETTQDTLITNPFETALHLDFEKYKNQFKMLIGFLSDPTEQVILLLRLGYIRNQKYTEKEIGQFLHIDEAEVHHIIQKGLSNLVAISTMTIQGVESARQMIFTKPADI